LTTIASPVCNFLERGNAEQLSGGWIVYIVRAGRVVGPAFEDSRITRELAMTLGMKAATGWMICAAMAAGVTAGQAPAAPAAPKAAAGAPTTAQRAKASLEPLLQQGTDALAAGQYKAAREAFLDAIAIDPRNVKAHHGLALCLVAMKEVAKGGAELDRAMTMTTSPDRALVLNAAAANMATNFHMRAAKVVKDYLSAHPKEIDEPMVNALGTALFAATPAERKNRFFGECASFYMIANQRLEGARPGYKRFGSDWLPARDADAKTAAIAAKQKQLDNLSDAIATAESRLEPAKKELDHQEFLVTRGETPGNYYVTRARSAYDAAKAAVDAAQERYDALAGSIETPKFPGEIQMVAMDQTAAPPVTTEVAVASIDPPAIDTVKPKPNRTKPRPDKTKPTEVMDTKPPEVTLEPPRPTTPRKVRITQYAAAFPVTTDLVVTSAAIVEDEAALQLQSADGQPIAATLVRKDDNVGLALLRVTGRTLKPLGLAESFNGGPVTCASFPTVDLFSPAAQAITGNATQPKDGWTVSLNVHPRLAGAPLIQNARVVGVCVAPRDAERAKLPAVTLDQLKTFLGADGLAGKGSAEPVSSLLQLVTTRETGG
jgi:tetratricopeptide (TPR) repeat protein